LFFIHIRDAFASEIAWILQATATGVTVARRTFGYYEYENEVTETVSLLPRQQYNFTILDSYGDGITNKGFYRILGNDGSLLAIGNGSFGRQRSHIFYAPSISTASPSVAPSTVPPTSAEKATTEAMQEQNNNNDDEDDEELQASKEKDDHRLNDRPDIASETDERIQEVMDAMEESGNEP
jgi:hypothetical protein